jgi:hypothetical protein
MMTARRFLEWLNEMAFARDAWIERARDDFFKGALMEYTCYRIAQEVGVPDNWSHEVGRLLGKVVNMMNPKLIKTASKFDREKALAEAMREAGDNYGQVVAAKNKMMGYYPDKFKQIKSIHWDAEDVFAEMIKEFLPKYSHLLP